MCDENTKIDVIDLIIKVMQEHEKKLDELIARLRRSHLHWKRRGIGDIIQTVFTGFLWKRIEERKKDTV